MIEQKQTAITIRQQEAEVSFLAERGFNQPENFQVDRDGVFMLGRRRGEEVQIAYTPVWIDSRLEDVTTGSVVYRVAWIQRGRTKKYSFHSGDLLDPRRVSALFDQDVPVVPRNIRAMSEYFSEFIQANEQEMPSAATSDRFGWVRDGFLWGSNYIASEGSPSLAFSNDDAQDSLVESMREQGSLKEWLRLMGVAARYPRVRAAFYAAFASILVGKLNAPNFILNYSGGTSTGKTTASKVAASVYGYPDEKDGYIQSWDSTRVGDELMAQVFNGLLYIKDDTKTISIKDKAGTIRTFVYTFYNGRGRTRGRKSGGVQHGGGHRGGAISSSEQPMSSYIKDGGGNARVLNIGHDDETPFEGIGPETAAVVDALNDGLARNYGFGLPIFVRYLQAHEHLMPEWDQLYADAIERHRTHAKGNVDARMARSTALFSVAATLVHRAFEWNETPLPWSIGDEDPMECLLDHIFEQSSMADVATRARDEIYSWAVQNAGRFGDDGWQELSPVGGWLGYWPEQSERSDLQFHPNTLKEQLRQLGYEADAVLSMWAKRGWLDCAAGKVWKQIRVTNGPNQSKRRYMIVLKASAFPKDEEESKEPVDPNDYF